MVSGRSEAEVYDEGKQVRVVLEAPGLTRDTGMKWAHRIVNGQLLLRGILDVEKSVRTQGGRFYSERQSERFLKLIPLPAPIKAKPSAVRYRNGLLELTFDKRRSKKTPHGMSWIYRENGSRFKRDPYARCASTKRR